MSKTQIFGVITALLIAALLLFYGVHSNQNLTQSLAFAQSKKVSQSMTDKPLSGEQQQRLEMLKAELESKLPGIQIDAIEPSPMPGFYQAFFGGELVYVSADGQFLFTGNMLELAEGNPVNHSQRAIARNEQRQAPVRAATIANIDESEMVVFRAADEKYVVTVFTDVDCAYCRKLHKEMPQLNKKGITIRYMAFPRAGIGSDAYRKLVSIWCSQDPQAAMNEAKLERKFGNNSCKNPVAAQYNLTRKFKLNGTPALILDDGELISGYLPAEELRVYLAGKKTAQDKVAEVK